MKKSIRKKINSLLAVSLIVLSFCMILFNLLVVYNTAVRNSEIIMSQTSSSQALKLNNQFGLIEQAVNNLYSISERLRPDVRFMNDDKAVSEYIAEFEEMAVSVAESTEGALALYYRINPEITGSGTTGFFRVRSADTGRFQSSEITDLYDYDPDDTEHVGWYYVPVWAGKPVWMEPYYNANIDLEMISYVVPIYDGYQLVGVLGIDLDFGMLKNITEDIDSYESCGAVLCSMEDNRVYYNKCSLLGDSLPENIYDIVNAGDESENIADISIDGRSYGLYYQTLDNGMKFIMYAAKREVFGEAELAVIIGLAIFAVVFTVTLLISIKMSRKIIRPIDEITEAAKKYAQGDWDAKVYCDTGDELQVLSENISRMSEETKKYIRYIQDIAKTDSLTGLRNKNAYKLCVDSINSEYIPEKKSFAVVVFDVNNLKFINDNYGHEKGDELISASARAICQALPCSTVFRIGGDEFAAVAEGYDLERIDDIIKAFQSGMEKNADSIDTENPCIACGMAVFGKDGSTYNELFEAADKRMYENKASLKKGQASR